MATILVIDDDLLQREMLAMILRDAGHQVVQAENGKVGLELFDPESTDIVITDIYMPEKEGIETIRELRQINPEVNIIAVSGTTEVGSKDFLLAAQNLGAKHVLAKPFMPNELLDIISKLL